MPPSNLERRRQAIADALREAMTEELPKEPTATVTPLRPFAHTVQIDADEDDVVVSDPPSVPPFEPAGEMSATASRALFGHH